VHFDKCGWPDIATKVEYGCRRFAIITGTVMYHHMRRLVAPKFNRPLHFLQKTKELA
jgi:hypothetical protein